MIGQSETFAFAGGLLLGLALWRLITSSSINFVQKNASDVMLEENQEIQVSVLPCIRNRRSDFPSAYLKNPPIVHPSAIRSLLDAALYGPYHGRCFKGNMHPAKFVVLGKQGMVQMQRMTLAYYDKNWSNVGWGSGSQGSLNEYQAWRQMTQDESTGRWGPCSYMIAIVMTRQSGPKRLPEWEESAAVAAAV